MSDLPTGAGRRLPTPSEEGDAIMIFDQARLPRESMMVRLASLEDAAHAISVMQVRGAPLIGTTAAYDIALGIADDANDARLQHVIETLAATGPTAVNLYWVAERTRYAPQESVLAIRRDAAWNEARNIATEDKAANAAVGWHGPGAGLCRALISGRRWLCRHGRRWRCSAPK